MASKRKLGNRMVHPVGLGCMNLSWAYGERPPQESNFRKRVENGERMLQGAAGTVPSKGPL